MSLRQVTEAEIAAANLRRMARDLILEAERLEASAGCAQKVGPNKKGQRTYVDPVTKKKKKVTWGKLPT